MPAVFCGKRVGFGIFRSRAGKDVSEYVGGAYETLPQTNSVCGCAPEKIGIPWAPQNESSELPNPCNFSVRNFVSFRDWEGRGATY